MKHHHFSSLITSYFLITSLLSISCLGQSSQTATTTSPVFSRSIYQPFSLLFTPTTRFPVEKCDFELGQICQGWKLWNKNNNDQNYENYDISIDNEQTTNGNSNFKFLTIGNSSGIYLMSPWVPYNNKNQPGNVAADFICFSFYFRIRGHGQYGDKINIWVLPEIEGQRVFDQVPGEEYTEWQAYGKYPHTWSWLGNTVMHQLPDGTTAVSLLFYLESYDSGDISLDDILIFNTSCNLKTPEEREIQRNAQNSSMPFSSLAVARQWPGAVIPYTIGRGFSKLQQEFLLKVLEMFSFNTCVKFRKRTFVERNNLEFVHTPEGCSSQRIGFLGGTQKINLGDFCFDLSTLAHELLHVIGLFHEHQRPDRDNFISVMWSNILPGYNNQFTKYAEMDGRLLNTPYDYGSVMHYRGTAFSLAPGVPSMLSRIEESQIFGSIFGPSPLDYFKVKKLYCDSQITNGEESEPVKTSLSTSSAFHPRIWPGGYIPYEIDPMLPSNEKNQLEQVMEEINRKSCIKFHEKNSNEVDYVYFQLTESTCYAKSGKQNGRQIAMVSLGKCFSRRLLFWLLLHIVGLDAEHRRTDRDGFIVIHEENIQEGYLESFQKFDDTDFRILSVPYDISSVLHYRFNTFSISNTLNTISTKANVSNETLLGISEEATLLDYAKVYRLYSCPLKYWKDDYHF